MRLTQDEVQDRLVANRLGRWAGRTFVGEHCLLGKNGTEFLVYPKSDDPQLGKRIHRTLQNIFADADNVTVEEPIGEPWPAAAG